MRKIIYTPGSSFPLVLGKECVIACAWNVKKVQRSKWCKSLNNHHTDTHTLLSWLGGKDLNHLHNMGTLTCLLKLIYIYT